MSTQHVQQVPAVVDDQVTLERVKKAVDQLDSVEATRYAVAHGVNPPTDDRGWELLIRFEADGSEGPLVWVLVTETDDVQPPAS